MSSNSKILNKSNSILSNIDWNGNTSRDDSKNFFENFNDIIKTNNIQKKRNFSQKPKNLFVSFLIFIT